MKQYTLQEISDNLNGQIIGDPSIVINKISSLENAKKGEISFLSNKKLLPLLSTTKASAIIITKDMQDACKHNAIVLDNPYLAFAQVGVMFDTKPDAIIGIHKTAIIGNLCDISSEVSIGTNVVIGNNSIICDGVEIGSNTVISNDCYIADDVIIGPNVTIYHDVKIGQGTIISAGAVIGADGFGNVKNDSGDWVKIPQLGGVRIGEYVQIGSNTTIDRGSIDNTILHNGVKIDNLVQIAHNVKIGQNTALAGQSGVAGSTKIGSNCLFGGQSAISGHINIVDNVILLGSSGIAYSINKPGIYSSHLSCKPHIKWKKIISRLDKLNDLTLTVNKLKKMQDC